MKINTALFVIKHFFTWIKSSYIPVPESAVCKHHPLMAFRRWPPFFKVRGQMSKNMLFQQIRLVTDEDDSQDIVMVSAICLMRLILWWSLLYVRWDWYCDGSLLYVWWGSYCDGLCYMSDEADIVMVSAICLMRLILWWSLLYVWWGWYCDGLCYMSDDIAIVMVSVICLMRLILWWSLLYVWWDWYCDGICYMSDEDNIVMVSAICLMKMILWRISAIWWGWFCDGFLCD